MQAWRDDGRGSSLESGPGCYKTGRPFSEDATSHSYRVQEIEVFKVNLYEISFHRERLRPSEFITHGDDVWTGGGQVRACRL